MKAFSPAQSLILLALAGIAVAGWAYGIHWKRVASGDLFSADERLIIQLQDQIGALTREAEALRGRLRELENGGYTDPGTEPANAAGSEAAPETNPPEGAPVIPRQDEAP